MPSVAEERHLLAAALDHGVEPEVRLEVVQIGPLPGGQPGPEMVPLDDVPALLNDGVPQQRGALQLVADEVRPLGRDDEEPDKLVVDADAGAPRVRFA